MNKLWIVLCMSASLVACNGFDESTSTKSDYVAGDSKGIFIDPADPKKITQIEFLDTLKDLGNVKKSAGLVDISFRFKNVGKNPLSINSVSAGCGCTSPEKPGKLIQPGEEGVVKAKFKTEGQTGEVTKNITVISNTNPQDKMLFFKAKMID